MKKNRIVLVGGGGHCKVVIDAIKKAESYNIYGIIDPALKGKEILGIPVVGDDNDLPKIFRKGIKYAFITVGSIGNCDLRKRLYEEVKDAGFKLPHIEHPNSVVSPYVEIDEGAFIAAGAIIGPGTKIGKNVIVNTNASIDHDCEIGDFVHIAPGVTLSGGIKVGEEAHIGTGATIIQYLKIGKKSFIRSGELVTRDVGECERYLPDSHEKRKTE
jgi:UDP-perosamine 4-acetyltransferase